MIFNKKCPMRWQISRQTKIITISVICVTFCILMVLIIVKAVQNYRKNYIPFRNLFLTYKETTLPTDDSTLEPLYTSNINILQQKLIELQPEIEPLNLSNKSQLIEIPLATELNTYLECNETKLPPLICNMICILKSNSSIIRSLEGNPKLSLLLNLIKIDVNNPKVDEVKIVLIELLKMKIPTNGDKNNPINLFERFIIYNLQVNSFVFWAHCLMTENSISQSNKIYDSDTGTKLLGNFYDIRIPILNLNLREAPEYGGNCNLQKIFFGMPENNDNLCRSAPLISTAPPFLVIKINSKTHMITKKHTSRNYGNTEYEYKYIYGRHSLLIVYENIVVRTVEDKITKYRLTGFTVAELSTKKTNAIEKFSTFYSENGAWKCYYDGKIYSKPNILPEFPLIVRYDQTTSISSLSYEKLEE